MKNIWLCLALLTLASCHFTALSKETSKPYEASVEDIEVWSQTTKPKDQALKIIPKYRQKIFYALPDEGFEEKEATPRIKEPTIVERTRILAWGSNYQGQLGNGERSEKIYQSVWASEVEKLLHPNYQILDIDAGRYNTCILRSDRTVWCWGGVDTRFEKTNDPAPRKIQNLPPVVAIDMGSSYTFCAKTSDAKIWCWDSDGELATEADYKTEFLRDSPDFDGQIVEIFITDRNKCAILKSGDFGCWGKGYGGNMFKKIIFSKAVKSATVGLRQACVLLNDDTERCWKHSAKPKPFRIFEDTDKVIKIFGGWHSSCALKREGTVWCWRIIQEYENNKPHSIAQLRFANGKILDEVIDIDNQGNELYCALKKDTSVWCWRGVGHGFGGKSNRPQELYQVSDPMDRCGILNVKTVRVGANSGYALVHATADYFKDLSSSRKSCNKIGQRIVGAN